MSVLHRKLLRELWTSKWMLLAIIGIIAVGVICMIAMGSAYFNLTEAKDRYYTQCRMADFSVDLKKVPLAELDAVPPDLQQAVEQLVGYLEGRLEEEENR